jgi:dUTP pyrophosphatase
MITHRGVVLVDCGFSMEISPGYKAEIMARSGWASKGVVVTNAPGQIDEDYRGRIKVIIGNFGTNNPVVIKHGDKIAQMAIVPVWKFEWQVVTELSETVRGAGGFGSTGGM